MKNIIFYFTGTGNSLKVAKSVADGMGDCEIVSMGKAKPGTLSGNYDSVGFVYPTYFRGLPRRVGEFVSALSLTQNKNAYYYAITTCGGSVGNGLSQLRDVLWAKQGVTLHYGQTLRMFANYVIMYDMSEKVAAITEKSNEDLVPIVTSIKNKETNRIRKSNKLISLLYQAYMKHVSTMDKNYAVSDACIGCGICKGVCPVGNIEMVDNKPHFRHRCEQCLGCLHYCPQRAINYKQATQTRRRYTHPEIRHTELAERNKE